MGKPLAAAEGEVDFAADITEYYADNIDKITGDTPIDLSWARARRSSAGPRSGCCWASCRGTSRTTRWPVSPRPTSRWATRSCSSMRRSALESAAAIAQMYLDAGFPEGAYVDVRLTNEQSATVIADPRVQGVSVTGSERAGAAVAEIAGRNLKKVALELGGSDPFILLSTDDLDGAVQMAVEARLDNNGQSCNAAKRFIVAEDLYDPFVEKFTEAMADAKVGDPFAEDTVLGPLSSLAAAERLAEQVDRAVAQGVTVVTGGVRDGAYYPGTVITGRDARDGRLPRGVLRTGRHGLQGLGREGGGRGCERHVVRTRLVRVHDRTPRRRSASQTRSTPAWSTSTSSSPILPSFPSAGVKRSGTGREMGLLAADEFVNKKLIRVAG